MKPRILIVEDDLDIQNFIQIGLKTRGYDTLTAGTGEESVFLASQHNPDLILMDIVLPGISGLDACWQIKHMVSSFIPIILVTVKGDIETKVNGTEHGADDFLTKPFILEELYSKVRAMLRIKERHDQLEKSCVTDALTQVYNRRYFDVRLQEECDRSRRTQKPFTTIMLDLDHFKKVNDTHGHPAGDAALQHFVHLVKSLIRKTDILIRYGGEEFVLMLPETPLSAGQQMAEIIRSTVEANPMKWSKKLIKLTCSMGVSSFPNSFNHQPQHLLQSMDEAVYRAKQQGRNRIHVYSPFEITNPTAAFSSSPQR